MPQIFFKRLAAALCLVLISIRVWAGGENTSIPAGVFSRPITVGSWKTALFSLSSKNAALSSLAPGLNSYLTTAEQWENFAPLADALRIEFRSDLTPDEVSRYLDSYITQDLIPRAQAASADK